MGFSDQLWGLNLPADIEMVDPLGCYFGFKRTEATRMCPSLLPGGALGLRHWAKALSWPTSSEMLSRFDMDLKRHQR